MELRICFVIRENDQVTFGVDALYKLLNDLQLVGTIHSIGPGDDCHIIYNRRVVLVDNTDSIASESRTAHIPARPSTAGRLQAPTHSRS
ncbi:hypothetical protein A2U01_0010407 [Trifolium medium]|uniref:Uncharacterized protein n=1 Tax=Trifolium medium TaxID=97028 RepID=A0A392MQ44_9FABA|nr:hypothetical protein [Trifolium medium]